VAFVLDASAALPWCFRDEATRQTDSLLALVAAGERVFVPSHWPSEILNGLTRAVRRGRLDDPSVDRFLRILVAYDIVVDALPIIEQWGDARALILKHRLSAYDTAYLSLAKRLGVSLATLDEQLRLAAEAEGVALVI
jgi:predicted nucleic acid-binding protein